VRWRRSRFATPSALAASASLQILGTVARNIRIDGHRSLPGERIPCDRSEQVFSEVVRGPSRSLPVLSPRSPGGEGRKLRTR
jgi:hypothetical protein